MDSVSVIRSCQPLSEIPHHVFAIFQVFLSQMHNQTTFRVRFCQVPGGYFDWKQVIYDCLNVICCRIHKVRRGFGIFV